MAAPLSLVREVERVVGADHVSQRESDRVAYSRDLWPRDLIGVREGVVPAGPEMVVWPGSVEEVAKLVKAARKRGLTVVPFGGGAGVCGAARAGEGTLVVDLKRLRRIRSIDPATRVAEIESGIVGEVLERELNHRGWTLGHFPSSIYCSTLGGFVAGRSAGQLSTKYGKIEDMVVDLEHVLPDGEIHRFADADLALGPELAQLFVGAEGTLGITTAARLRVSPIAEEQILQAWSFKGVARGMEAMRTLLQAGVFPAVMRLYDEFDTVMALSSKSHAEKKKARAGKDASKSFLSNALLGLFPDAGKQALGLVLGQAKLLNKLAGAVTDRCLLVLMFEGPKIGTTIEANETERILHELGAEPLGEGPAKKWKQRRYAISYRQSKVFASGAFNDTAEVAATWDTLPAVYRAVKEAVGRHAFVMAHFSHAYPEGCSIYFTFVAQAANADASRKLYDAIWADLLAAVVAHGGTISHHHGVGLSKARFLPDELGEGGFKALVHLKETLDAERRFNPGKLGL